MKGGQGKSLDPLSSVSRAIFVFYKLFAEMLVIL